MPAENGHKNPNDAHKDVPAKAEFSPTTTINSPVETASLNTTHSDGTTDPAEFLTRTGYEILRTLCQSKGYIMYRARLTYHSDAPTKKPTNSDDHLLHQRLAEHRKLLLQPHQNKTRNQTDPIATTQLDLAIKVFDLTEANSARVKQHLQHELLVARSLCHAHILPTLDVIKTHHKGYVVSLWAPGGSLEHDLYDRHDRPYTAAEAHHHFAGLMAAVEYLHHANIVHRSLRLRKFLLSAAGEARISDFGQASAACQQVVDGQPVLTTVMCHTRCESGCGYQAPELLLMVDHHHHHHNHAGNHGPVYDAKAADVWSMGVCLYEMVTRAKPYPKLANSGGNASDADRMRCIRGELWYPDSATPPLAVQDLIGRMVRYSPAERPSATEVMQHRWLAHSALFNNLLDKSPVKLVK